MARTYGNGSREVRVLLSTYGSRADVEPVVALAVQLLALGAEVRVCAPPEEEFTELLARVGMPLVPGLIHSRRQCWRLWLGVIHLLTQGIQKCRREILQGTDDVEHDKSRWFNKPAVC